MSSRHCLHTYSKTIYLGETIWETRACAICCIPTSIIAVGFAFWIVFSLALEEAEGNLNGDFIDEYSGDYNNFFGDSCNDNGNLPTSYRGDMAVTQTGLECMAWNSQHPHAHGLTPEKETYANKGIGYHNFCRNPDDEPNGAWCYTMDQKVRWEYCACCKSINSKIHFLLTGIIYFSAARASL